MPLKLRRGTDAERQTITPAAGEPIYTTDTKKLYVGDGTTLGGNAVDTTAEFSGTLDGLTDVDTTGAVTGSVIKYNGTSWEIGVDDNSGGGGGGLALTDLSVTTASPGSATLTYNNLTGVFTYTPPDLSTLLSEVPGNLDINGSIFGDDSTLLVDGVRNLIPAAVLNGTATINVIGNLTGDADGNHTGTFNGVIGGASPAAITGTVISASSNFAGNLTGNVTGNVGGNLVGNVNSTGGQVIVANGSDGTDGSFRGNVLRSTDGVTIIDGTSIPAVFTGNLTGDVTGNITGNVSAGTLSVTSGADVVSIGDIKMTNDNDGLLIIGNATDTAEISILGDGTGGDFKITATSGNFSTGAGPAITLQSQNGTHSAPTANANQDLIGTLNFKAYDGAVYQSSAYISALVNDTSLSQGSVPDASVVIGINNGQPNGDWLQLDVDGKTSVSYMKLKGYATGAEPATPEEGTMVFDSTTKKFKGWDGTAWQDFH